MQSAVLFVNSMETLLLILACSALATGQTFQQATAGIWNKDGNRLCDSDLFFKSDPGAGGRIFEYVNEAVLTSLPTFVAFEALFDLYERSLTVADNCDINCETQERDFVDLLMTTGPMQEAWNYLKGRDENLMDQAAFEDYLWTIWFQPYTRNGHGAPGPNSSGFQHVFMGEVESNGDIGGLHNWVRIYREELVGNFQFSSSLGPPCASDIPRFRHDYLGGYKSINSMWVRTSPELEFALYTMCFHQYPGVSCGVEIDNINMNIQTYTMAGSDAQVGSAYPLCS